MALLAGKAYDPATAVTKATSALLALTALDTTNLRNVFTVPANGAVQVRLQGVLHGGSGSPWTPSILLGVLEGTTVRGRVAPACLPMGSVGSATQYATVEALFNVYGLTPGASLTWDAAYAVEGIVAASGIKYGGPNTNATASDAFGAFLFEIYTTG